MLVRLKWDAIERDPNLIWNTFVEILCCPYEDLSSEQRPAHLVFLYESEVQNGGHLQFFENHGTERLGETLDALAQFGAHCQRSILAGAGDVFESRDRVPIISAADYVLAAREDEFGAFDKQFYECAPPLIERLGDYLKQNESQFVQIEY